MGKKIIKIGGSNLKTNKDLYKIIKQIKSYNTDLIIVVSAAYGVTDLLENLTNDYHSIKDQIKKILEKYVNIFEIVDKYKLLEKENELLDLVIQLQQNPSSIEIKNKILVFGEKLTALFLSDAFNKHGIPNQTAYPETFNLLTTNKLQSASIHKALDSKNLKNYFRDTNLYIVPGFYGITKNKQIALFGRGGSDYTAAILANALDAESLDLWKDVSGFLSTDPRIVENARKIENLTYLEAAELAYFGAKIIHPGTIRPLLQKNIPLNIKSFNSANEVGTKIFKQVENKKSGYIKSITYSTDIVLLRLRGSGVGIKKGILKTITTLFDENDINIRSVITSQIEIDFLINTKDLKKAKQLIDNTNQNTFDLEIDTNIALIAAVGDGIKQSTGIAGKIFGALAAANINIKHIVFGASEVAIYLIVAKIDTKQSIIQIHKTLFN